MSRPIAFPCSPTRRALISRSAPAPEPRSSTISPSCRSATAVGTPQPSDAFSAASGASPASAEVYSAPPNTCVPVASVVATPQQAAAGSAAAARAAAAYLARTVSRMSATGSLPCWPAEHPQLSPAALVAQQAALSEGSQQLACASV